MVSSHETYIRCSWTFRFICLALPLIIHLRASSALDYVHGKPSSVAMEPDIASAIFIVSTSLALSRILASIIPFYADEQQTMTLKVETMLICLTMILANIVFCDLALRLIWIPIQYVLWWVCKHKILTLLVKAFLFVLKDFAPFRPYYLKTLAVSGSKRGFHFLRLMTVLQILYSVLLRLERYPKSIETVIERNSPTPACDVPEGRDVANVQEKDLITNPSS
ncbi:uncharacterized protein LOC128715192 [Anopheles marshallii]|uniref:uncharacterized protein LOC128715192 n=1 Tax=Anopheles marshallii TaxID=1521116 RepID=UPI00237C027C|nr:uncharacterized protein LOC128715192 [Anopheles marshallii]